MSSDDSGDHAAARPRASRRIEIPEELKRRSGRSRQQVSRWTVTTDDRHDHDELSTRRRGKQRGSGAARAGRKKRIIASSLSDNDSENDSSDEEEEEVEDLLDGDDSDEESDEFVQKRVSGRQRGGGGGRGRGRSRADPEPQLGVAYRKQRRNVTEKKYTFSSDSADDISEREGDGGGEEDDDEGDVIEKILAHRQRWIPSSLLSRVDSEGVPAIPKGADVITLAPLLSLTPDPKTTSSLIAITEYLIKWKDWSHIHNTWGTHDYVNNFLGSGRLDRYLKKQAEREAVLEMMTEEEREQDDVAVELRSELEAQYILVEKVLSWRESDSSPGRMDYFCKWKALAYSESSWEEEDDIAQKDEIAAFWKRCETWSLSSDVTATQIRRLHRFNELAEQPDVLKGGGYLRDYQLEGLNWMLYSWFNNTNGILADEMGLGKTIQAICFLSYLSQTYGLRGPFLCVVPLSTLAQWIREFSLWAPHLNVVAYVGDSKSRAIIREHEFHTRALPGYTERGGNRRKNKAGLIAFSVLLTTYELTLKDSEELGKISWPILIVDEAHRLKNDDSALYQTLSSFSTENRLLITGTPLQNSLRELWSLVHFLDDRRFPTYEDFEESYSDLTSTNLSSLHGVLKPFILRRLKKDVAKTLPSKTERILRVDMSPLQKQYYRWILTRNLTELNKGVRGTAQTTLLNIVMELKKCCNHPYLFENAEDPSSTMVDLIRHSGKMVLLDKLLMRLKETGHRVLIFSQMVRMLDILSDYLESKHWEFQRLDGSVKGEQRQKSVLHFNEVGSTDFCFLLSTRAGGLGINLQTADTVIIFDSDWNPQNDLQAEARAHRIGQVNAVNIYRLITTNSIDEEILERAKRKMVLDHLVIQSMDTSGRTVLSSSRSQEMFDKNELSEVLKVGVDKIFDTTNDQNVLDSLDLDEILTRAETVECRVQTSADDLLGSFKVAEFKVPVRDNETDKDDFWKDLSNKARTVVAPKTFEAIYRAVGRSGRGVETLGVKKGDVVGRRDREKVGKGELSVVDMQRLMRATKRFGVDVSRVAEIAVDASVLSECIDGVLKFVHGVQSICQTEIENLGSTGSIAGSGNVEIFGIAINCIEFEIRYELMKFIGDELRSTGVVTDTVDDGSVRKFKVDAAKMRAFSCPVSARMAKWDDWDPADDPLLLIGAYEYGFGNWEEVRLDTKYDLVDKIAPLRTAGGVLPKGDRLNRRVETLMKSYYDIKKGNDNKIRNLLRRQKVDRQPKCKHGEDDVDDDVPKKSKRKQRRRVDRKSNDGDAQPKVVISESVLRRCQVYMTPCDELLRKLRALRHADISKEERVAATKKYLLSIGSTIEKTLERITKLRNERRLEEKPDQSTAPSIDVLRAHMWHYASETSGVVTGEKLGKVYEKLKLSRTEGRDTAPEKDVDSGRRHESSGGQRMPRHSAGVEDGGMVDKKTRPPLPPGPPSPLPTSSAVGHDDTAPDGPPPEPLSVDRYRRGRSRSRSRSRENRTHYRRSRSRSRSRSLSSESRYRRRPSHGHHHHHRPSYSGRSSTRSSSPSPSSDERRPYRPRPHHVSRSRSPSPRYGGHNSRRKQPESAWSKTPSSPIVFQPRNKDGTLGQRSTISDRRLPPAGGVSTTHPPSAPASNSNYDAKTVFSRSRSRSPIDRPRMKYQQRKPSSTFSDVGVEFIPRSARKELVRR